MMNDKLSAKMSANQRSSNDEQWVKDSLQEHLDNQVDDIDYVVASKLSAARHRATAQQSVKNDHTNLARRWFGWPAALGSTAVLVIAVLFGLQVYQPNAVQTVEQDTLASQGILVEDLNLLSATDDIEFYQSVEFLEWMENNSG